MKSRSPKIVVGRVSPSLTFENKTRLAKWYYSHGEALTAAIWSETLQELNFAGLDQIMAGMEDK